MSVRGLYILHGYMRDYAFIHWRLRLLGTEMVWQCYQTLSPPPHCKNGCGTVEMGLGTRLRSKGANNYNGMT